MTVEKLYTAEELKSKCVSDMGSLLINLGFKREQVRNYQGALKRKIEKIVRRAVKESKD